MRNLDAAIAEVGNRIAVELKELEAMNKRPAEQAVEKGLKDMAELKSTELEGSEKQVKWAQDIIATFCRQAEAAMQEALHRTAPEDLGHRWAYYVVDSAIDALKTALSSGRAGDVISASKKGPLAISLVVEKAEKKYRDNK